jgi:probable F420-dependent oxidoreductase
VTSPQFAYGVPLSLPLNPAFTNGPALSALAHQAESAGFDAIYVTEHPAPSQRWRENGGHDALDPFVALAVMAQATTRLRLLTNLTVIPYRNPFLLAKAAATVDLLSGGRLILGAGVGYQKSEFAALGVGFDDRNARFDEYLHVLKLAWQGEPVTFEGAFVSARGVTSYPPTVQRPGPPIWLGGNSQLTRRRVAEEADGWMPMPSYPGSGGVPLESLDDLKGLLAYLRAHADSIGRTKPIDVLCVMPAEAAEAADAATIELVQRHAELSVTWLAVNGKGETGEEAQAFLERFGSQVIDRLR